MDINIYKRNGEQVKIVDLSSKDILDLITISLANIKRFGGSFDEAISVLDHCLLVREIVNKEHSEHPLLIELNYNALLHEVEEGMGVGDICHDVKSYLLGDSHRLYTLKDMLYKKLELDERLIKGEELKSVDIAVGMAESSFFSADIAKYQYSDHKFKATAEKIYEKYKDYMRDYIEDLNNIDKHYKRAVFIEQVMCYKKYINSKRLA